MDKFSPKHLIFLIWGVGIVSMKTYPRTFVEDGLRESWIAVIISSIIFFVIFIYIINIYKKMEKMNFVDIYSNAFGEKLGKLFIYLFIITCFFVLLESASVEADSMHQNMLISTPKWYFLIFFIIPIIYVVNKNLVSIVTVCIIGISMIMLAGTNLGILTTTYKHPEYLFPIFSNGITSGFILSILETLGQYGCISIILPYLIDIQDKKNNLTLFVVIALIITIQIQIVSITGILMTFELPRSISINYPKLLQTQLVSYFQFFDYGELYVMLQIVGGWALKYIVSFYAILSILRMMNVSKKRLHILSYVLSFGVLIFSYYASRNSFILFDLLNILQYIFLANFVIIPLIGFTLLNIKGKIESNEDG